MRQNRRRTSATIGLLFAFATLLFQPPARAESAIAPSWARA